MLVHQRVIPNTSKCPKRWTRAPLAWQPEIPLVRPLDRKNQRIGCIAVRYPLDAQTHAIQLVKPIETWLLSRFPRITQQFPCPYAPCMVYLPTFGWFWGQMLVNIPYMEHMGWDHANSVVPSVTFPICWGHSMSKIDLHGKHRGRSSQSSRHCGENPRCVMNLSQSQPNLRPFLSPEG